MKETNFLSDDSGGKAAGWRIYITFDNITRRFVYGYLDSPRSELVN